MVDLLFLLLFPFLAAGLSLLTHSNYFISTLLFLGLPSLYLSAKSSGYVVGKVTFFASVWAIPLTIMVEFIALHSHSWFIVPLSVFPFRIFGVIPVEDVIWGFLFSYTVVIFYVTVLQKAHVSQVISPRMKAFSLFWALLFLGFLGVVFYSPSFLFIKYTYFVFGVMMILLPTLFFFFFSPKFIWPFLKTGVYFFVLSIVFEMVGLHLHQWMFPSSGYFIGWIHFLGFVLPVEEFFFWCVMGAMGVLTYYQVLNGD